MYKIKYNVRKHAIEMKKSQEKWFHDYLQSRQYSKKKDLFTHS